MNTLSLSEFLELFSIELDAEWSYFKCPFCSKVKAHVNDRLTVVKCWRCGYRDSFYEFAKELGYRVVDYAIPDYHKSDVVLELPKSIPYPVGFKSFNKYLNPNIYDDYNIYEVEDYINSRGFTVSDLGKQFIGYVAQARSSFAHCLVVPFFNTQGELIYYAGRSYRDKRHVNLEGGVGKSDVVYNAYALLNAPKIYVYEGWANAQTCINAGYAAVSTQGWNPSDTQLRLFRESRAEFVFVPDAGYVKPSQTAYKALIARLRPFIGDLKVKVLNLNKTPITDDLNSFGIEGMKIIRELEKNSPYINKSNYTSILLKN